ncbi:MAG: hypothetical protein QF735_12405 [Phycisphaeraceae bacterium]|jgi:hypothetical protein|nr:hypothetical protein [Phycisphaeraceae bacterium]
MRTTLLSDDEFQQLTDGAEVIAQTRFGNGALRAPDGRIIKILRPQRLLSSGFFRPQAHRFVAAARRLGEMGIPAPRVTDVYRITSENRYVLRYHPVPGVELRNAATEDHLLAFACFIADLHGRGIYFRGLHLGNVVVDDAGRFGLIDCAATCFGRRPLPVARRARNFRPLAVTKNDIDLLRQVGLTRFFDAYLDTADLTPTTRHRLMTAVAATHPAYKELRP